MTETLIPRAESTTPLLLLPNAYRAFFGGFERLHPIQEHAIAPILEGRNLVLQATTGSGKTEAVLAPCVERIIRSGGEEAVLYVAPTRALAVDLERRFASILVQRLGLQLGIRTGDAKRWGVRPNLVLTTPESMDVLIGSPDPELQGFLRRVRTVIIDEVHPFLYQYRGKHLFYLLRRLERKTGGRVQKIALSATIADVDAVFDFFEFGPHAVRIINSAQRDIVPHLVHIKSEEEILELLGDLHRVWGYRKILMFANSRGRCDRLFALAGSQGAFRGIAELHYSNLKPRGRRGVEDRFRRRSLSLCIATSTLELGIDIGDVDSVILFEPPDSVSAFLQRIGRSNRRESRTHFWGICQGERAGEQLLRFVGQLQLARQGVVEKPLPNAFPSVLVQQILSCLYEKKRISFRALGHLFPEHAEDLELILPVMEKLGWLRRDPLVGERRFFSKENAPPRQEAELIGGGWRYRKCLLERKIWSNLPETEESYVFEVAGEAVADLPRSIVCQLEPGDHVNLAGKHVRIVEIIDSGERKRVCAKPTAQPAEKVLAWLGAGFQVSFEVAQSIRAALTLPENSTIAADQGLFIRTGKLLEAERQKSKRAVTLDNGIELLREDGIYQYRTFLGSIGNLIARLCVEHDLGFIKDLEVNSDEIGITCTHWIDFGDLSLPVDRGGFRRWVAEHLHSLRTLLPVNSFADALPEALFVEELTGFLYDSRVAEQFLHYLSSSASLKAVKSTS